MRTRKYYRHHIRTQKKRKRKNKKKRTLQRGGTKSQNFSSYEKLQGFYSRFPQTEEQKEAAPSISLVEGVIKLINVHDYPSLCPTIESRKAELEEPTIESRKAELKEFITKIDRILDDSKQEVDVANLGDFKESQLQRQNSMKLAVEEGEKYIGVDPRGKTRAETKRAEVAAEVASKVFTGVTTGASNQAESDVFSGASGITQND